MSKQKIDKVKESKMFRMWDILVYVILIALILILLWAFVWRTPEGELDTVDILLKDKVIASYDFKTGELEGNQDNIIIEKEDGCTSIIVYIDKDKKEYNEIVFDNNDKSVKMNDANCSQSKDCTLMKPITKAGQNIICVPHQLVIRANGEEEIKDPISG